MFNPGTVYLPRISKNNNQNNWSSFTSEDKQITTITSINKNADVHIKGSVHEPLKSRLLTNHRQIYVQYWAPAPPDFRHSHNGSGLPFPNESFAYSNTVNTGRVLLSNSGNFVINIKYPNSFYKVLGTKLVKPNIKFMIVDENSNIYSKIFNIVLGESIPNRSLVRSKKPYLLNPRNDNIRTKPVVYEQSVYNIKEYPNACCGKTPLY